MVLVDRGLRGSRAARGPKAHEDFAEQVAGGVVTSAVGSRLIFNDRLDAVVTILFMVITILVVLSSAREWVLILTRRKPAQAKETPFVETAYAG